MSMLWINPWFTMVQGVEVLDHAIQQLFSSEIAYHLMYVDNDASGFVFTKVDRVDVRITMPHWRVQ
jgi:hypothetical protein